MLDRFVSLRLAKSTIFTNPIHLDIKTVITRIATLSHDPSSIRTPYIQDIINQILIILHLVILFHQRMWPRSGRGWLLSETCYCWFGMFDIIVMPGFVLEIYKLFCAFYLHTYLVTFVCFIVFFNYLLLWLILFCLLFYIYHYVIQIYHIIRL